MCKHTRIINKYNQEINGAGLLSMWNAVPLLPALRRSPRRSRSSCWPAPSCRCRRTPPGRPAWTPQPWRWAPSTGWGQTCPALEMATKEGETCSNLRVEHAKTKKKKGAVGIQFIHSVGKFCSAMFQVWRSAWRRKITPVGRTSRASSATHMWFTNAQPDVAVKNRWCQRCCKSSEQEALRQSFPGEKKLSLLWSMISRIVANGWCSKANKPHKHKHSCSLISIFMRSQRPPSCVWCCLLRSRTFPMWLNQSVAIMSSAFESM